VVFGILVVSRRLDGAVFDDRGVCLWDFGAVVAA
jgi:hypothetical protein